MPADGAVPGAAPAARRRPPGRYDEPSRVGQRVLAVLLGLSFVGLLVAIALAFYGRIDDDGVDVREIGFSVVSDRSVRVDFEVVAPPGTRPYCLVRAREAAGREVGREFVRVGPAPADGEAFRVSHVLSTSARPVTGEAPACALSEPPADRPSP